jgi:hypothetical protein
MPGPIKPTQFTVLTTGLYIGLEDVSLDELNHTATLYPRLGDGSLMRWQPNKM